MPRTQRQVFRYLLSSCILGCACWATASEPDGPEPTLRIPKETYALGETIFFWTGVRSKAPMSAETYEPCEIEVIDPDLKSSKSELLWPTDGNGTHGWSGGHGVAEEEVIPGEYVVRVTCEGKTIEGRFTVVGAPVLENIETRFDFAPGCENDPSDTTVTLTVVNHSEHRAIVSRPGALMADNIWFQSEGHGESGSCHAFFPEEILDYLPKGEGDVLIEEMTYDKLEHVPHVELPPGESYELSFCLSTGEQFCPFGWPPAVIKVGTTLQALIGTSDGPHRELGAVRLSVDGEYEPPSQ